MENMTEGDVSPDEINPEIYGYSREDVALLKRYACGSPQPGDGYVTDFTGVRHTVDIIPSWNAISGKVFASVPIPTDGFHAEAIEYIGLFLSIEEARETYTMFELGAGWGPWMCLAGAACRKRGFASVNLIGVEGIPDKIPYIKQNLVANGLRGDNGGAFEIYDGVATGIYQGIVTTDGSDSEFPLVAHGSFGATLLRDSRIWTKSRVSLIKGYKFEDLSRNYPVIDLVHIDLQGYEKEFIESCARVLARKVKFLVVGTHTRAIEGFLIEFLYRHGFRILREKPCSIEKWPEKAPDNFLDITVIDGTQVWRNCAL